MKKILILGILAIFVTVSLANVIVGGEKQIDTNEFSVGNMATFANKTSEEVLINMDDGNYYNDTMNIFVYNNATYDFLTFDVTGEQDPETGQYPSDVSIDLGDNGRPEYRFSGYGVGQWGNQTNFMTSGKSSVRQYDMYPSSDGDIYYVKVPTDSVITSAEINFTHPEGAIDKTILISSGGGTRYARAYTYMYRYSSYSRGYSYRFYRDYYTMSDYDVQASSSYRSGYPQQDGLLYWNINDANYAPPPGATIQNYDLILPIRLDPQYGYISGQRNYYHYGARTYSVYALDQAIPTSSYYGPTIYDYSGTQSSIYNNYYNNALPDYDSSAYATYSFPHYHSSSSADQQYYPAYDLSDLLVDWQDGTQAANGILFRMSSTNYDTYPHDRYGTSSSSMNYFNYYENGYLYGPGASSSYNSRKPQLHIAYTLDSIGPWADIGDDGVTEWENPGYFNGTQILSGTDMVNSMNDYLTSHFPDEVDDYGNSWSYIPIRVGSEAGGKISASDLKVTYDYTASVYYNPTTETIAGELGSLVPSTEEGWSLINLNVESNTRGKMNFENLVLQGQKPNYRPTTMDIPQIDTNEGIIQSDLLKVNDYFDDIDQDDMSLNYIIQMNDRSNHVDLMLSEDVDGMTWLGIDTTKDENWNGEVTCQISATDDFGKDVWSNEFIINIEPVNDIPYTTMEIPDIVTHEGIDPILMEYNAPSGRNVARGKETFLIGGDGVPYFADIEMDKINLDFELLGPDMVPVNLEWSNEDGYKIFRDEDNKIYLTVLPPEYTEDPDNFLLILGSDPDFTTVDGPFYLNIFASDDPVDLWNQTLVTIEVNVDAVNDPPSVLLIPDIIMNEDQTYVSTVPFIEEYVTDIDNDYADLEVNFYPADDNVMLSINDDGLLVVDLGMDFNGVVPVTMEISDGENIVTGTFNVRIRSINDPPVLVVGNLFDGQRISGLFRIKGSADDIEKNLKFIEVAVTKAGEILYSDDWITAEGAYVWQYLLDIRDLSEGEYMVFIRAFDGRDFSEVLEYQVHVIGVTPQELTDPPVVTIDTPLTGEIEGSMTISGTVKDESGYVSFVEYRIDGGIWRKAALLSGTEWSIVVDTNTLTNEEHNLSVRAYDDKSYSDIEFKRFEVYNVDSDGDGIPNDLEKALLMDPFNKLDGTMDFDNDGFSNQAELIEHNTDPFSGISHPPYEDEEDPILDTWAIIFIAAAIVCAIIIIGLFILNIRLERNMHTWREDLNRRRVERKPKTLLQKIVEIAPSFIGAPMAPAGPALPGQPATEQAAALPPMQEGDMNPPA